MFATMSGITNDKVSSQQPSGNGTNYAEMQTHYSHSRPDRYDTAACTYKNERQTQSVYDSYLFDTTRSTNTSCPIEEVDELDLGFFHGDLFTTRRRPFAMSHSRDKDDQTCSSIIAGPSSNSYNHPSHTRDTSSDADISISSRSSTISSRSSSISSSTQESSKQ